MRWVCFLHLYQPVNQHSDVLKAVVNESYLPILRTLSTNDRVKVTLNVSGSLLEALDNGGHRDVIDLIRTIYNQGKIELTNSSMYHAFLPLTPKDQVKRQIEENTSCLKFYINKDVSPEGFFSPEMAISPEVIDVIAELPVKWLILDEICASDITFKEFDGTCLPVIKDTNIVAILRNRRFSNLIMSALIRSRDEFLGLLDQEPLSRKFIVTGMDGETFGHHRPGLVPVLESLLLNKKHQVVHVSDLLRESTLERITGFVPRACTWASSLDEISKGVQFLSWKDNENEIHSLQWDLTQLVIDLVENKRSRGLCTESLLKKFDSALASDHFWWASAKPWWSIEMIEDGAFRLFSIVKELLDPDDTLYVKAKDLYFDIITTSFEWQRSGIISKRRGIDSNVRIPFLERTLELGGVQKGIYEAFMSILYQKEKECASNGSYEQAIMWRDAQTKINDKNDIYDAVHAIDLLRKQIPHEIIEKILDKYTEKYKKIRGGQPEQRD
jgi:alpha-amylase/alpha-mannosidase (GH57 family)